MNYSFHAILAVYLLEIALETVAHVKYGELIWNLAVKHNNNARSNSENKMNSHLSQKTRSTLNFG